MDAHRTGFLYSVVPADAPVLVVVYMRLTKAEEKDSLAQFGAEYAAYMQRTPAFIPKFSRERKPV